MRQQLDLIMFDLDGTLANTGRDIAAAVNYVRRSLGLGSLTAPEILRHLGLGLEFLIRGVLPPTHEQFISYAGEIFLDYYRDHLLDTTVLYPHVIETLDHYAGKKKAVISNKPTQATIAILDGLGIQSRFDMVLGANSTQRKKPHAEPLNHVLEHVKVAPRKALMVGDDRPDIEAGKSAGVHTCGVTYGLGSKVGMLQAGPDRVIDDLLELRDYYV
jgi:phosphoglycolate phosphatase